MNYESRIEQDRRESSMNKSILREHTDRADRGTFYAEWKRLTGELPRFDTSSFNGPGAKAAVKGSARRLVIL